VLRTIGTRALVGGRITAAATGDFGLVGESDSDPGVGGISTSSFGVQGTSVSSLGILGESDSSFGIEGISSQTNGIVGISAVSVGVLGISQGSQPTSSGFGPDGVVGMTSASVGTGVVAINSDPSGDAFLAINQGNSAGPAALFLGSVTVAGNLTKSSGSFQIDHPGPNLYIASFGYKREEIVGKPVTVLIPTDRLDEETEILQHIRAGLPSERLDTIRVAKDGKPIHGAFLRSRMHRDHVIGASKVVQDITALGSRTGSGCA